MKCERCYQEAFATIMSMFNTQTVCLECKSLEEKEPRYDLARREELAACKRGDFNFKGVGR